MDDIKTKGTAILKDYINQMRAAGFGDPLIKEKLLEAGSISVPNQLPTNFGQTWSTGMFGEFKKSPISRPINTIPSPNEYMEYMPGGGVVNRIPTYEEFSNRNVNTGGFKGTRNQNLMAALQRKLQGYSGPTVGASQTAYEMGIVGLPQQLANQWIPQYMKIAEQKAEENRKNEEYENLQLQYPQIDIQPGDTADMIAQKIMQYDQMANYMEESKMPSIVSSLDNAVYQATLNNESISVEDVINASLQLGYEITFDQANAIFTSALKRAQNDMEG